MISTPVRHWLPRLGSVAAAAFVWAGANLSAADAEPVRGPFWSGTIMRAKNSPAAMKGVAITLGSDKKHYAVYDLDTLRMAVAWGGEFLEFGNTLTKIEWPPPPSVKGTVVYDTAMGPGWAGVTGSFADPRPQGQGPLPKDWAHYSGLHVNGDRVVLRYSIGKSEVLESPGVEVINGNPVFTRTFQFISAGRNLSLLAGGTSADALVNRAGQTVLVRQPGANDAVVYSVQGAPRASWDVSEGRVVLKFDRSPRTAFTVSVYRSPDQTPLQLTSKPVDLRPFTKGGPARWTDVITTAGKTGTEDGPYVVDTITEPYPNVYNTRTFFGGFDFLPDGRAVICAFHGDVWIVSGLDQGLGNLAWKRFASGLFQPLGVKVHKGEIYVACRDQITRLKDLNKDGEADYYENFNNDTVVTPNYHEFVLDLHTDSKGNFYYAKGAPWEPSVTSPHQGTILKVSPDGKRMEVFATGLRAPNGMTVGPDDTVLVGDNQGHWMPSSKLNWVKPGAFMGMVPAAQKTLSMKYPGGREIRVNPSDPAARKQEGLKGWDKEMPIPTQYDEPLCWVPMKWDNSSGGQVFVSSDKWGPYKGAPLFMSYGKCALYAVLWDRSEPDVQAAMAPFNLKFQSGIMRGRFNPKDGQLYLCGLKGWQNSATRDGGFYRVRYTGKPVRMPVLVRPVHGAMELKFATDLDPKSAVDSENFSMEIWNYRYSGAYGSPEISVKTPGKNAHDSVAVKSASLGTDLRTLRLELNGLVPADQYSIKYNLKAADGSEIRSEVFGTLRNLDPKGK